MIQMPGILIHQNWDDHRIEHDMKDDLLQMYCRDGGGWKACLRPKLGHQVYMSDIVAILDSESPREICVVGLRGGGWKTVWAKTPKEVTYPGRFPKELETPSYEWHIKVWSPRTGKDQLNLPGATPKTSVYSTLEQAKEAIKNIVRGNHLDPSIYKMAITLRQSLVRLENPEPYEVVIGAAIFKINKRTQERTFEEGMAYGHPRSQQS